MLAKFKSGVRAPVHMPLQQVDAMEVSGFAHQLCAAILLIVTGSRADFALRVRRDPATGEMTGALVHRSRYSRRLRAQASMRGRDIARYQVDLVS